LQGLAHHLLLPLLLGWDGERLQAAATAMISKDAWRPAALAGWLDQAQQLRQALAPAPSGGADLSQVTGNGSFDHEHLALVAGDAAALTIQVGDPDDGWRVPGCPIRAIAISLTWRSGRAIGHGLLLAHAQLLDLNPDPIGARANGRYTLPDDGVQAGTTR
jgi:hypothetical protein